ncbi:MAG: FAD:protein FMN transferase [Treponema sp.]|nr:FAD:protein FMN transferase [Treponema sp.]
MKLFFLVLSLILFFSCSKENTSHKKNSNTSQESSTLKDDSDNVRICASVPSVQDEYVPLFNTNVFIRSSSEDIADKIENDLVYYHKLFDAHHFYYDDSENGIVKNLKTVNEHIALLKNIQVKDDFAELLSESFRLMKLTNDNLNIFLLPVSMLYSGYFSSFPISRDDPNSGEIKNALKRVLFSDDAINHILIDKNTNSSNEGANNSTLSFLAYNKSAHNNSYESLSYEIDFGALAKGFAAKKISEKYTDAPYLLSIGSSTLFANKKMYRIGIASPYYKTLALLQINLADGFALSTSGTTNSYYILSGKPDTIRCHILDPRTGYSNNWWWNVIVISDNALVSDALSTALFNVKDEQEILEIISSVRSAYKCIVEVCFVKNESSDEKTVSLVMTKNFEQYIRSDYEGIGIIAKHIISENL